MWLVYIKILYDNFSLVKLLVWAFIIYIIIGTIYLSWGWIGIIVLVLLIIAFVIYILMLSKKQRKRKTQINNNVVNNVYNFSKTHNLKNK